MNKITFVNRWYPIITIDNVSFELSEDHDSSNETAYIVLGKKPYNKLINLKNKNKLLVVEYAKFNFIAIIRDVNFNNETGITEVTFLDGKI